MLICFDFDGVLANSAKTKFKIFKEAGERFLPREHNDNYLDFLKNNPNARREEKLTFIASKSNNNLGFLLEWFQKSYRINSIELFHSHQYLCLQGPTCVDTESNSLHQQTFQHLCK